MSKEKKCFEQRVTFKYSNNIFNHNWLKAKTGLI